MSSDPEHTSPPEDQEGGGVPEIADSPEPNATGVGPRRLQEDDDALAAPALAPEELCAGLEALLYASPEPLSTRELKKAFPEAAPEAVAEALATLRARYAEPSRGLQLVEIAGGFQITTRPEYHDRITRLLEEKKPTRLTTQALETLSVIAYKQPVTIPEIMDLRGVRSAGVVRTLLEKRFIRIVGRKNVVGRPLLYGTTKEFLLRFGLKDLSELPRQEDFEEIFQDNPEIAQALEALAPAEPPPDASPEP